MTDGLDYQQMTFDALRGMVRRVLAQVAQEGLPGEHHFYLTFRVEDPGVVVPAFLRQQYPQELQIVLQHRFQDLEVGHEEFSVTLWFGGKAHRLTVPFQSLLLFHDPSVPFALQFPAEAGVPSQLGAPDRIGSGESRPDPRPEDGTGAGETTPHTGNVLSFPRPGDK